MTDGAEATMIVRMIQRIKRLLVKGFLIDRWIPWLKAGDVLRPRWVASAMYLFFTLAAVLFIWFSPLDQLESVMGETNIVLWHLFMLVGSGIALLACITKRPLIEAGALILLITAMLAYAFVAWTVQYLTGTGWGNASMFMAIALGLLGRFIEMMRLGNILADLEGREDIGHRR